MMWPDYAVRRRKGANNSIVVILTPPTSGSTALRLIFWKRVVGVFGASRSRCVGVGVVSQAAVEPWRRRNQMAEVSSTSGSPGSPGRHAVRHGKGSRNNAACETRVHRAHAEEDGRVFGGAGRVRGRCNQLQG